MALILDRDALRAAIEAGGSFEYRPFFGHHPREDGRLSDACFSQWWMGHPFVVDGVQFTTAEHFMMAAKARIFRDETTRDRILAADEPGADGDVASETSRGVSPSQRWARIRRKNTDTHARVAKEGRQ